jgi:hypothetical protein
MSITLFILFLSECTVEVLRVSAVHIIVYLISECM